MISRTNDAQVANNHPCYFLAVKNWYWSKVPIPCNAVQQKEHHVAFVRKELLPGYSIGSRIRQQEEERHDQNITCQNEESTEVEEEYSALKKTEISNQKLRDNHQLSLEDLDQNTSGRNEESTEMDGEYPAPNSDHKLLELKVMEPPSQESSDIHQQTLEEELLRQDELENLNVSLMQESFKMGPPPDQGVTDDHQQSLEGELSHQDDLGEESSDQELRDNHQQSLPVEEEELGHQNDLEKELSNQELRDVHPQNLEEEGWHQDDVENELSTLELRDVHQQSLVGGLEHHDDLEKELSSQDIHQRGLKEEMAHQDDLENVDISPVQEPVKQKTSTNQNLIPTAFLTDQYTRQQTTMHRHMRQYETFVMIFYGLAIVLFFGIALVRRRRYSLLQSTRDIRHGQQEDAEYMQRSSNDNKQRFTNAESLNSDNDVSREASSLTPVRLEHSFALTDTTHRPENAFMGEPTKATMRPLLLDLQGSSMNRDHTHVTDDREGVVDTDGQPNKPKDSMATTARSAAGKKGLEKQLATTHATAEPNPTENDLLLIDTVIVRLALLDDDGKRCNYEAKVEPDLFKRTIQEWESILPIETTTPYQRSRCHCLIQKLTKLSAVGMASRERLLGFVEEWVLSSLASSSNSHRIKGNPNKLPGMVHDLYQFLQTKYELPGSAAITLLPFLIANATVEDICCEKRIGQLVFEAGSKLGPFYEENHGVTQSASSPHSKKAPGTKNAPRKPESVRIGSNQLGLPTALSSTDRAVEGHKTGQSTFGGSPAIEKNVDRQLLQKIIPKVIEGNKASPLKTASFAEKEDGLTRSDNNKSNSVRPLLLDVEGPSMNQERDTDDQTQQHGSSRLVTGKRGEKLDKRPSLARPLPLMDVESSSRNQREHIQETDGGKSEKASIFADLQSGEHEKKKVWATSEDIWEGKELEKVPIHGSKRHQSPQSKSSFLYRERYLRAVINLKQKIEAMRS